MNEVLYETRDRVATLTLNRPEQRNAVSPELTTAMDEALRRFEADDDAWVGVLAGAGPNFCAGADLKAMGAGRAAELSTEAGGFAGFVRFARTKPMIAAPRGFALAGGTELVLQIDGLEIPNRLLIGDAGAASLKPGDTLALQLVPGRFSGLFVTGWQAAPPVSVSPLMKAP